jgi:hypothetical protein
MVDMRVEALPLDYKRHDTNQTLREALREHRANITGLVDITDKSHADMSKIDALFAGHDVIHCLFGLGSSVGEEIRVDTYTICASTMTFRRYLEYMTHPSVLRVLRETTTLASLPSILWSILRIPGIWWKTRSISRWDFDGWEPHLDTPLVEIRVASGITL